MAYWGKRTLNRQKSPPDIIKPGKGVNTFNSPFEIDKDEAVASLNTSNRGFPALSTRPGTTAMYGTVASPITTVNGATARAGSLFHVVDGTTWKYWDGAAFVNVATGLANAKAKFVEFTTAVKKYTILVNGTDKKAWDGSAVIDLTDGQATALYAANDNRLFSLIDSSIYASDIGDITNWTTGDSDRIGLYGMIGSGTALIVYNDLIIGWSDQTMHVILGKTSDEFDPTDPLPVGNVSDRATLIHGPSGLLYWLDYGKFMAFTGGLPFDISQKVKGYLENVNYTYKANICAGQWGKYIYLSVPYGAGQTTNNLTLEYDTDLKMWYPWDIGFSNFYTIGQDLYGITPAGVVKKLNQGTADDATAITWSHTSGVEDPTPLRNRKAISDMWAIVDLPVGSTLVISYSTTVDGNDFATLKTFTANANEQNTRIQIPTNILANIPWHRRKLSGTGPCSVHYLEVHGRVKPR